MELEIDANVTEITVKMPNGQTQTFNFLEELEIDKDRINDCYVEQAGKYAWWGVLYEYTRSLMDVAKAELDEAESDADAQVRQELDMEGVKVTEAIVTRRIKKTAIYREKMHKYLNAKRNAGILERVMKAFDQRLNALISIGANMRNEYTNTDLAMKKEMANKIIGG